MKTEMKHSGSDSGHWLWFMQRITGIAILITVSMHWILNHFGEADAGKPLAWDYSTVIEKIAYAQYRAFYLVFLAAVLLHAFHGLWMVGRDYLHAKWARTILAGTLICACFFFLVWGISILFGNYGVSLTIDYGAAPQFK